MNRYKYGGPEGWDYASLWDRTVTAEKALKRAAADILQLHKDHEAEKSILERDLAIARSDTDEWIKAYAELARRTAPKG